MTFNFSISTLDASQTSEMMAAAADAPQISRSENQILVHREEAHLTTTKRAVEQRALVIHQQASTRQNSTI